MSCETCRHAEMCRWIDEVGARGCDFEEQAQADNEQKIHYLTDEAYSELCLLAAKGREALQAQADGEYVRKKDVIGCIGQTSLHFELARKLRKLPTVSIPSAEPKAGHCKDCKYFEYDSVAMVDGIPLIVAHEICKRWSDGCKTKEDGYCFLFEPQENGVCGMISDKLTTDDGEPDGTGGQIFCP